MGYIVFGIMRIGCIIQESYWLVDFRQASTLETTPTVCSLTCTTVSTASPENWPTPSFLRPERSTLMMMSTGFWETCASAGIKACVFLPPLGENLENWNLIVYLPYYRGHIFKKCSLRPK